MTVAATFDRIVFTPAERSHQRESIVTTPLNVEPASVTVRVEKSTVNVCPDAGAVLIHTVFPWVAFSKYTPVGVTGPAIETVKLGDAVLPAFVTDAEYTVPAL